MAVNTTIYMGETKISGAYFGENVVQRMYLGTNLVYERLPQPATPSNLSISNYALSFDAVENAKSYEVFADNNSIGEKAATRLKRRAKNANFLQK